MEMIERVARAICFFNVKYNGPKDSRTQQERIDEEWGNFTDDARAAIGAMREPTEAMLDCGVAFALQASVHGMGGWSKYVAEKHRAMIDAALSQGTEARRAETGTGSVHEGPSPQGCAEHSGPHINSIMGEGK